MDWTQTYYTDDTIVWRRTVHVLTASRAHPTASDAATSTDSEHPGPHIAEDSRQPLLQYAHGDPRTSPSARCRTAVQPTPTRALATSAAVLCCTRRARTPK